MVNSLIFKENKGESLRKQILQPIDLKGKKPSPGITERLTVIPGEESIKQITLKFAEILLAIGVDIETSKQFRTRLRRN